MMSDALTLVLIRHGKTVELVNDAGQPLIYGRYYNPPLSEKGIIQVSELSAKLLSASLQPDLIVTSPLCRAYQTADLIHDYFSGAPLVVDEGLMDFWSENMEGRPLSWVREVLHNDPYNFSGVRDYEIEAPTSMIARVFDSVRDAVSLCQENLNESPTIFVVGHGDPLAFFAWAVRRRGYFTTDVPKLPELQAERHYLSAGTMAVLRLGYPSLFLEQEVWHLKESGRRNTIRWKEY